MKLTESDVLRNRQNQSWSFHATRRQECNEGQVRPNG